MGNDVDYVLIGKRITQAREEAGLLKKQLAEKIGKAPSTIGRYESGKFGRISIAEIEMIAKVLNVNPAWLHGVSEDKEVPKDVVEFSKYSDAFNSVNRNNPLVSDRELSLIQKYRMIDSRGRETVDTIVDLEFKRCRKDLDLMPIAAHANSDTLSDLQKQKIREFTESVMSAHGDKE